MSEDRSTNGHKSWLDKLVQAFVHEPKNRQELLELLRDQFNLRMQKATGQLAQTHLLGQVRRDIARVKTVLNEKQVTK